jgi:hypothetical protein
METVALNKPTTKTSAIAKVDTGRLEYQNAANYTHLQWANQLKAPRTIRLLPIINRSGVQIDTDQQPSSYYEYGNMPKSLPLLVDGLINSSRFFTINHQVSNDPASDYQMQLIINQYELPFEHRPKTSWLEQSKSNVDRWFVTPKNARISLTLTMTSLNRHMRSWSKSIEMTMARCDLNATPQPLNGSIKGNESLTSYLESTPGQTFVSAANFLILQSIKNLASKRELAQVISKYENELFLKADHNYFVVGESVNLYHNDQYESQRALPAGQVRIIKAFQNQAVAYPISLRADHIKEGDWVEVGKIRPIQKPRSHFEAKHQCANVSVASLD